MFGRVLISWRAIGAVCLAGILAPAFAQSSSAADSQEGAPLPSGPAAKVADSVLLWRSDHLLFRGVLTSSSGPSLRPADASGVSMVYEVINPSDHTTLATVKGVVKVFPMSETRADLYPPAIPEGSPRWAIAESWVALQFTLLPDSTFRLTQSCNGLHCFPAQGAIDGNLAGLVMRAALKQAPNQGAQDTKTVEWASRMGEIMHQTNMGIINNMNSSCRHGEYCP